MPTPQPAHSPAEPLTPPPHLPSPGAVLRALLRHQAGRALGRCSTTLRAAADTCTRLRWHLEDCTTR